MENHAYEVAKARALALCRAAAADPIPVEDALAHLERIVNAGCLRVGTDSTVSLGPLTEEQEQEIQALALIFEAVGSIQEIGAALGPAPEEPAPVVIHRPQAGAVVVPKPSNVR